MYTLYTLYTSAPLFEQPVRLHLVRARLLLPVRLGVAGSQLEKTPPPKLVDHQRKYSNNTRPREKISSSSRLPLWRRRWYRAIGWGLGPKRTFPPYRPSDIRQSHISTGSPRIPQTCFTAPISYSNNLITFHPPKTENLRICNACG